MSGGGKRPRRPGRLALRIAGWIGAALLCWLITLAVMIIHFGGRMSERASDAAIVLGAAVQNDEPSPVFAARLDHAIDLQRRGIVRFVVLTGGMGEGDRVAESEAGARYAADRGVPRERILTETVSRTTRQNLIEAKRLMRENGLKTCLLVSDPLHMRRASMMLKDLGMDCEPSATPHSRYRSLKARAGFLLRELYFYHHYLLFGQ